MKYCPWLLLLATTVLAFVSCSRNSDVNEQPPLLLEEPGGGEETSVTPTGPVADNSRCYVCHLNYEEEELATVHAKSNIGCETCHGESYPHAGDEANVTPPDIMYPKERINLSCLKCHPADKLSDVHAPVLAGRAEEKYCTDCHGEHRLAFRTQRWDKATGEPLEQK